MMRFAHSVRAAATACVLLSVLSGCAHTPAPQYYVLSAPESGANTTPRGGPRIGLGPITLPDYLDRPQIVTRATATRLDLSNSHRWAEPVSASFSRALLGNLMRELPDTDIVVHPWRGSLTVARQIRIEVLRFDSDQAGAFKLSARWSLSTSDKSDEVVAQVSDVSIPVNGAADDYDALVTAANGAVSALATTIAAHLRAP